MTRLKATGVTQQQALAANKALLQYGMRRNLRGVLQQMEVLERGGRFFPATERMDQYMVAARVAMLSGEEMMAFSWAKKAFFLDTEPDARELLARVFTDLTTSLSTMRQAANKPAKVKELDGHFSRFVSESLPRMTAQMQLGEASAWLKMLEVLSPEKPSQQKLALRARALSLLPAGQERAKMALEQLRDYWVSLSSKKNPAHLEEMKRLAQLLVKEGGEELFGSDQALFLLIMLFDFCDSLELLDPILEKKRPFQSPDLEYFLELVRLTKQDLPRAYALVKPDGPLQRREDSLKNIIIRLAQTRIFVNYLDQAAARTPAPTADLGQIVTQLMLRPIDSNPELKEALLAHLKTLAGFLQADIKKNDGLFLYGQETDPQYGAEEVYIIYDQGSPEVAIYIGSNEKDHWLKFLLPVQLSAGEAQVEPAPKMVSSMGRQEPSISFLLKATGFLRCIRPDLSSRERLVIEAQRDKLGALLPEALGRIFLRENRSLGSGLLRAISADQQLQNRGPEINNRLLLAGNIFRSFLSTAPTGNYSLPSEDPLHGHVRGVRLLDPQEIDEFFSPSTLKRFLSDRSDKYPLVANFLLHNDPLPLLLLVDATGQVIIPGLSPVSPQQAEPLLALIYETAINLSYNGEGEKTASTGYVFEGKDDPSNAESGLGHLRSVYDHYFRKQLQAKGILPLPWFNYEPRGDNDGLYRPLPNQSLEAKMALTEEDLGRVFVQVEPAGQLAILPVRKKRVGGQIELAPWERQPLREEQQALLGDVRTLPNWYGLYVITTFSDGKGHAFRHLLKPTEEEILNDQLLASVERLLSSGAFRDPNTFLQGTPVKTRRAIEASLASNKISIINQVIEPFKLETTFRRPRMISVKALLDDGFKLDA